MSESTKTVDPEFILRVLRVFNNVNGPDSDQLWWRTDDRWAPVTFLVNCNDEFWWACADAEEITPDNVHVLEQAVADAVAASPKFGRIYSPMLFVARVRGMRPRGCVYPTNEPALWPLFDACGPERPIDLGNPKPAPAAT